MTLFKKAPKIESKINKDIDGLFTLVFAAVDTLTKRLNKIENEDKLARSDDEIELAVSKYFVHRYSKHECGAQKAISPQEYKRFLEIIKEEEEF